MGKRRKIYRGWRLRAWLQARLPRFWFPPGSSPNGAGGQNNSATAGKLLLS